MSFRKILVPTDFSEHAERAAEVAAEIAKRDGAELVLLHVSAMPDYAVLAVEPMYLPPKVWDKLWDRECTQIQQKLDALEIHVSALLDDKETVSTTYRRGSPITQVLEAAEELEVDLIVMGSQGAEGTLHYLFGGTAAKVARDAPCPVLIAPPGVKPRAPRKAVVGVDYSKFSSVAAELAAEAVGPSGKLTCLHVWQQPPLVAVEPFAEFAEAIEQARGAAVTQMDEFAEAVNIGECCAEKRVEVGSPAHEILECAHDIGADLIVVGSHGRHGVERVIGTTADRVLRQADVAVLMIPERALASWEVRHVA